MDFYTALTTSDTTTTNGMVAHSTSGSALVDLFYAMGASRNESKIALRALFARAFAEDPLLATKAAFYNRDIRGGQGERRSFRVFFRHLCLSAPDVAIANLSNVPHYGRWDDLLVAVGTEVESYALAYIAEALVSGNKLAAKWMPREGKKDSSLATSLRKFMGLTSRQYRKLLSGNTEVVESLMCSKQWSKIDYNKVPSVALQKYRRAWGRNDGERYAKWLEELQNPESGAKVNEQGVALVSGYSPSILKTVLSGGDLNPLSVVMETLNSERYERVTLPLF